MRRKLLAATLLAVLISHPVMALAPNELPAHVVRTEDGKLKPASGYRWVNPNDPDDLSVRLVQGLTLTADGKYKPSPGYRWVRPGDASNLEVELKPGLVRTAEGPIRPAKGYRWTRPDDPNDFSVKPAHGYRWVNPDDPNDYSVRLRTGLVETETGFRLAPGYAWLYPGDPDDLSVQPALGYEWVDANDPKNLAVRRRPTPAAIAAATVPVAAATSRQHQRVELGWMNITPCSKVEMIENDFGFSSPGLVTADQRLIAYADADITATAGAFVESTIKECALAGAAACGLSSVISSPAACFPTFKAAFLTCANARIANVGLNDLRISVESQCMW